MYVHATGFLEYGSEDDKQPRDSSDGSSNPLSKVTAFYSSDGAFAFGDFCALGLRYVSIATAADSDLREPALGGHIASLPYDNDRVFSEPVILVMEVLDIHGQYGRDEVTVNLQLPVLD